MSNLRTTANLISFKDNFQIFKTIAVLSKHISFLPLYMNLAINQFKIKKLSFWCCLDCDLST